MRRPPLAHSRLDVALTVLLVPALQGCVNGGGHHQQNAGLKTVKAMDAADNPGTASMQQAVQTAATDLPDWHPFGRLQKFLGRKPSEGLVIWRSLADVSLPGPDLANFPNSSYTLPQGGIYLESSPAGFYGSSVISSSQWNWEYLLRYGVTDNIEIRLFSNGLGVQSGDVGFSPLAFDAKAHLWAEEWDYFNVSLGVEAYVQTNNWLASPAFSGPVQHAFNLLVDHELPWAISFEWNLGYVRQQDTVGNTVFLPSFQWAFQRSVTDDVALFIQGYQNASSLPRLPGVNTVYPSKPDLQAIGFGAQWTPTKRIALFGSYNWGLTRFTPSYSANMGLAVSF